MASRTVGRSIAIAGMGCRLPGGIESVPAFWDFLRRGGDAIVDVPEDRWDAAALYSAEVAAPGRTYARRGGFLRNIDQFDPEFFGISPREAAHVDPQQRLLLETAVEAMEDAGERWEDPALRNTGVFVGVFIHDYQHMQFADRESLGPHTGTGTAMSIAANRVSYAFDFHGPSVAVDTACSSSLVAIDLACKAIMNGDCDFALAGGVNVILKPEMTIAMSKATMLSRDGSCKAFDARADGYVRGEGAGLVLLRRMDAPRPGGNRIYAIIRGSGVNSDGKTSGISVPNGDAQASLSRRVLHEAGVAPSSVGYIEAHGTGTPVGDPIEANALGRVFSEGRPDGAPRALLGSVKTNIGHLESASGVVGLMKAALCLYHRGIPANLHFAHPNPAIDFERGKLEVVREYRPWEMSSGEPRRAAVNSFGFGGTNAHVVLEEAPHAPSPKEYRPSSLGGRWLLPMGASDEAALRELATSYAETLKDDGTNARDLVYTVSQRRCHGPSRAAVVAQDAAELKAKLQMLGAGKSPDRAVLGRRSESFSGNPVFVFTGMGPQWWGMGRELLRESEVFRAEVERIGELLEPLAGWSLVEHLLADEAESLVQKTQIAQPAIFAIQAGLVALWRHWGVEPSAVMGHSVGEVAALYATGILTLNDAVRVVFHRSRLQSRLEGRGSMLAVGIDSKRALRLLEGLEGSVSIAAVNAPNSLTLSGDPDVLRRLDERLEEEGAFARPLQVEVPYHSPQMDPIREELLGALDDIHPESGRFRYYSTIDGRTSQSTVGDAAYWWRNVRQPVQFASAMDDAIDDGHVCFLEIGPHPVLRLSMQECLAKRGAAGRVVSTLRRGTSDFDALAGALGELHVFGGCIEWEKVVGTGRVLSLPPYPWQRSRHWSESTEAEERRKGRDSGLGVRAGRQQHALLGGRLDLPVPTWLQTFRLADHPYVRDHKVNGAVVMPGTAYLEMAFQSLAEALADRGDADKDPCLVLGEIEMGRALYLGEDDVRLETSLSGDRWVIHGYSPSDASWIRHAAGRGWREGADPDAERVDLDDVRERCTQALPSDYAYRLFRDVGLEYGPAFRAIEDLRYGSDEALARLSIPSELVGMKNGADATFLFHPALLDACLHTLFAALNLNGVDSDRRGNVFLPVGARRVRLYRRPTDTLFSHVQLRARSVRHFEADIRVCDESGRVVASVLGLRCQALEDPALLSEKRRSEWLFEYVWESLPSGTQTFPGREIAPSRSEPLGRWLLFVPHDRHPIVARWRERGADCILVFPGDGYGRIGDGAYTASPSSPTDMGQVLSAVNSAGSVQGIVHAWCTSPDDISDGGAAWDDQVLGAGSLLYLVQALAELRDGHEPSRTPPSVPSLWIVTQETQPVLASDPIRLEHSGVWGLRRVIANEHPFLSARIVDVDQADESWAALAHELGQTPAEDEIAYRLGQRHVHRLRRHLPAPSGVRPREVETREVRSELKVQKTGDLTSMQWVHGPKLDIGEHEVEIRVLAAGLNFKDVMKALGLFPVRLLEGNLWSHETLGMECAGTVTRVGERVTHVKPGDEVLALAPRSFASHPITHGALVCPNPGLSPTAAAGIPVAFLTASVALEELARLTRGERILIHAASGGVGQAAIQIAKSIGAEIFATVGSEAKRRCVVELGVDPDHVFDSRSLGFAEHVREKTQGHGVDVVLNSLAGDAIGRSLSVLADYGRFVELGKMDLDRDYALGLRPFTRCLSFHSVDLDRMLAQRVEMCGRILRSIVDRIAQEKLRPLPVTVYAAGEAGAAFGQMAAARHTGKLVVDLEAATPTGAVTGVAFRSDASYLVTGGLTGFGRQLAFWLATRGAGRLLLLGRRGLETPGAEKTAAALRALGAEVQVESCDVANLADVRRVLALVPETKPLRGVFHAAAVLDDALIKNLDLDRYRRTFEPKALGAWNLHQSTQSMALDHFMCFSSMASILGNQGSGNYCAANAFVDALAHYRRKRGLAALTVNWGVIADVGMAADEDFYRQNLERNGLQTIHSHHCLELLGFLMETDRVQTTVCPIDFETWLRFNPAGREGRLKDLSTTARAGSARVQAAEETGLQRELAALDGRARVSRAREAVSAILAEVFRIDAAKIDAGRSLTALGADSLMAIEIKNRLERLGLAVSVSQLLNRTSVATLAESVLAALGFTGANDTPESDVAPPAGVSSWFVCPSPNPNAKLRLFCFPYAGGGPGVYHQWSRELPPWIEVVAIALPGRGARADEPGLESIARAAAALVPEMLPLLDRPFALFGHCMGSILMYEVARRLEAQEKKVAVRLFASGCMAPHLYNSPIVHEQDDASFLDVLRLISFSGTRALIEDPDLRRTSFPVLRNDFRLVVEYGDSFEECPPLEAPITGISADNDLFAAPKAMQAWGRYTSGGYDLAQLAGDHYFVESDRDNVINVVLHALGHDGALPAETSPHVPRVTWMNPSNQLLGTAPRVSSRQASPRMVRTGAGPVHVLCFPPAGVRAAEMPLPSNTGPQFVYVPVEWHGGDASRSPINVDEAVERAQEAIRNLGSARSILLGHCLGAVVAYELALRLKGVGGPRPEHLVVTGVVGPHLYVAPDAQKLPIEKLLELLSVLRYPLTDRLRGDPVFRSERVPLVRADLEAMASYQYRTGEILDIPITAISLRHDLWSYPLRTDSWKHHTTESCEILPWDGDHYAGFAAPQRMHDVVRSLTSLSPRKRETPIDGAPPSERSSPVGDFAASSSTIARQEVQS